MKARERAEGMDGELSTYIYDKLTESSQNYQWRIVSDSHKGAVEIYLAVRLEVAPKEFVQDITAQVNDEGVIYFEEVVCFYDQTDNKIITDNYLRAIPVDPVQGVEAGYVDAFLKQLNIIGVFHNLKYRRRFQHYVTILTGPVEQMLW